jgi:hypothetical protein
MLRSSAASRRASASPESWSGRFQVLRTRRRLVASTATATAVISIAVKINIANM